MSSDRLFLKPAAGLKVREPLPPHNALPPYGKSVPAEVYWHRRLRSKDVVTTTEAEIAAGAAAEARALQAKAAKEAGSSSDASTDDAG